MDNNKKAARLGTGTASNTAIDKPHSTKTDQLGAEVKPSRSVRTIKKSWKRGVRNA